MSNMALCSCCNVFLCINRLFILQKVLELKVFQFLGSISHILYVFHNFERKVLDPLYVALEQSIKYRIVVLLVDSSFLLVILLLWCSLYKKHIDSKVVMLIKLIVNPLNRK